MSFPNQDPNESSLNVKINDLIAAAKRNQINHSPHYDVRQGPDGTSLIPKTNRKSALTFLGSYEFTSSYDVNDVVRQDANEDFVDEFSDTYTAKKGTYDCIKFVPCIFEDRTAIETNDSIPAGTIDSWLRQDGVNYCPYSGSPYWRKLS